MIPWVFTKLAPQHLIMSSTHEHEDEERDDVEDEQEIHVDVDSDSRISCGSGSEVDMEGGSCYDEMETPLR